MLFFRTDSTARSGSSRAFRALAGQLASGSAGARLSAGQLASGSAGARLSAGQLASGSAGTRLRAGLAVLLAAGCTGSRVNVPFDAPATDAKAKSYELRYKRPAGTADRYQAKYDVRVRQRETGSKAHASGFQKLLRDKFESDEKATAEVTLYYTGKTGNGKYDRVVFRRQNMTRDLLEVAPNGTVKHDKKPGAPFQPRITPNFDADPRARDLYYIPMSELGLIAYRRETRYHYAWYDSLCYMFPTFPEEKIAVGARWPRKVPVIVGLQYTRNVMNLNATFTFSDLRRIPTEEGVLCAVIEYTYWAILDTGHPDDADRLPPNAPDVTWRRFTVEGEGKAYFDIKAGKIAWKSDSYTILVEREYDRRAGTSGEDRHRERRKRDRPPEVERMHYLAKNTVEFSCRLLAPGERADERPSRLNR